jgi:hypothetical protein
LPIAQPKIIRAIGSSIYRAIDPFAIERFSDLAIFNHFRQLTD